VDRCRALLRASWCGRVNAEGELDVLQLTIEKLKLEQVHAEASLRDLQLEVTKPMLSGSGGKVRARISAKFLPRPAYDISAELDRINLSQLPGTGESPNGWPARRWERCI